MNPASNMNRWEIQEKSADYANALMQLHVPTSSTLDYATLSCLVDKQPSMAWQVVRVLPKPVHSGFVEEVYPRECDLIARYGQTESDLFSFQLNWRVCETAEPFYACIELWLSVQTQLLDTHPTLVLESESPGQSRWEIHKRNDLTNENIEEGESNLPCALVTQSPSLSCLWLIEPSDQHNVSLVSQPSAGKQAVELFGHFMEKGVIRRGRMRFLISPKSLTIDAIRTAYHDFSNSPLPLTA